MISQNKKTLSHGMLMVVALLQEVVTTEYLSAAHA